MIPCIFGITDYKSAVRCLDFPDSNCPLKGGFSKFLELMSLEKLKTAEELASIRDGLEAQGRKLVFTNGVFDLLHVGHVRYLQQARELGDALVVAVNGDASVRALKGQTRPINPELDRAELLAALDCVTYVTIFPGIRMTELMTAVRPQVYAKGGDYTVESLNAEERAALEAGGSQIRILPLVPGKSTTAIIEKWKS